MLTGVAHAEAVRQLKELKGTVLQNGASSSRHTTVGGLVKMYLDNTQIKRSAGTYDSYEEIYRLHIGPSRLANVRLASISTADCQRFFNERYAKGQETGEWGERRIEMMAHVLRASFNLGMSVRPQLISWNPLARLKKSPAIALPKIPTFKARALTHDQAMRLLDAIKGHDHEHLYWLLLGTGLRIGEALGLQWSDIDWTRRAVRVEAKLKPLKGRRWKLEDPKSEAGRRWIPLVDELMGALEAQRARGIRRFGEDFIFIDQLGEPYTQDSVRNHMAFLGDKIGIEGERTGSKKTVTPHDLRRSAATFLHGQAVPLAAIQHILGHTDIQTTMRYIDGASEELARQVQEAMDQAFSQMRATRSTS